MLRDTIETSVAAPTGPTLTPTEAGLLDIWCAVFMKEQLDVDSDFFDLGGYSLLAARIAPRAQELFGVELPLDEFYLKPTVRELAAYIDQQLAVRSKPVITSPSIITFKNGGTGLPLFFLHGINGLASHYGILCHLMELDRPMYGVEASFVAASAPATTLIEFARHCVSELRNVQPHGPYYLIGNSVAGFVAFEAAQQLRAAGEEVALLALLDTLLLYDPTRSPLVRFAQLQLHTRLERFAWQTFQVRRTLKVRARSLLRRTAGVIRRNENNAEQPAIVPQRASAEVFHVTITPLLKLIGRAVRAYRPAKYRGRIVFLQCPPLANNNRATYQVRGWNALAEGGLEVYPLSYGHVQMLLAAGIKETAQALRTSIEKLEARRSGDQGSRAV